MSHHCVYSPHDVNRLNMPLLSLAKNECNAKLLAGRISVVMRKEESSHQAFHFHTTHISPVAEGTRSNMKVFIIYKCIIDGIIADSDPFAKS